MSAVNHEMGVHQFVGSRRRMTYQFLRAESFFVKIDGRCGIAYDQVGSKSWTIVHRIFLRGELLGICAVLDGRSAPRECITPISKTEESLKEESSSNST